MNNVTATERQDQNKGKTISFIVNALLLLLVIFYYLPKVEVNELEDQPPYAVKVDFTFEESSMSKFAHEDAGAQRPKSESAPAATKTEEIPNKTEEVTKTQEVPEVVKPQEIEITKPQVLEVPKPDIKVPKPVIKPDEVVITKTTVDEAPVKAAEPKYTPPSREPSKVPSTTGSSTSSPSSSTTSGSTSGTSTGKPSTVNGKDGGTGKGTIGTGAGRDKGDDGDSGKGNSSDGTGEYDGSGDGVFGRKIIYRDLSALKKGVSSTGVVAIKVCINRAGSVTFAELLPLETTETNKQNLRLYLKAVMNYKFQADLKAAKEQCGKMKVKVDNTINNKLK